MLRWIIVLIVQGPWQPQTFVKSLSKHVQTWTLNGQLPCNCLHNKLTILINYSLYVWLFNTFFYKASARFSNLILVSHIHLESGQAFVDYTKLVPHGDRTRNTSHTVGLVWGPQPLVYQRSRNWRIFVSFLNPTFYSLRIFINCPDRSRVSKQMNNILSESL